jgi:hypothetical protein
VILLVLKGYGFDPIPELQVAGLLPGRKYHISHQTSVHFEREKES